MNIDSSKKYLVDLRTPGWGGNEVMACAIAQELIECGANVTINCSSREQAGMVGNYTESNISLLVGHRLNEFNAIIIILPSFLSSLRLCSVKEIRDHRVWLYAPFWGNEWTKGIDSWVRRCIGGIGLSALKAKIIGIKHDFMESIPYISGVVHIIPNPMVGIAENNEDYRFVQFGARDKILCIGRIDFAQKKQDWLLEALTSIRKRHYFESLHYLGDGPDFNKLRQATSFLDWVHVHGWSSPKEHLTPGSLLVVPSQYEGLPLVALEAISMGVGVIASRGSGLGSILPREAIFDINYMSLSNAISWARENYCSLVNDSRISANLRHSKIAFSDSIRAWIELSC